MVMPYQSEQGHCADVVIIGTGPAGLAAGVAALDAGASVIFVEENDDIGGHGMLSGGNVYLGGGNALQRALGIEDSPERLLADWLRADLPEGRFNDRELVWTFAHNSVATFDFLQANGVRFIPEPVISQHDRDVLGPGSELRTFRCEEWPDPAGIIAPRRGRNGSGLARALALSARRKGARFLLRHRFERLAPDAAGRIIAIAGSREGEYFEIAARRGVILATGGSSGNVDLRRTFDPRLTEVYEHAGAVYSRQTGAGEIAAMSLGASLWATGNQTFGAHFAIAKTWHIGCRWGYRPLVIEPDSPVFHAAGATGLTVTDWHNIILVNHLGDRFWNEADHSPAFINAALAYHGGPALNGGGPVWAIFDSSGATREGWTSAPPHVDPNGFFASGDTLAELARSIANPHQPQPVDGQRLVRTVERYNRFVDDGYDSDFGKPNLQHRIETGPFYAAWATPILHDSLTGLRTDTRGNVIDIVGAPIPGLYCAGESQGGLSLHGLGRCVLFGRLAGQAAAQAPLRTDAAA